MSKDERSKPEPIKISLKPEPIKMVSRKADQYIAQLLDLESKNFCSLCGKRSISSPLLSCGILGNICALCRIKLRGLICHRCHRPRDFGSDSWNNIKPLHDLMLSIDVDRKEALQVCFDSRTDSWYNIKLPKGGEALLCSSCIKEFKSITEDASTPDPKAISLLKSAYRDLSEAADLDTTSDHVQKNLESVKKLLTDLNITLPSRSDLKKSIAKEKKQISSSGSDIKTKPSPKGQAARSSYPSHSRHVVYAAFLMLIFIGFLCLAFYYIYPFLASFVNDMVPTELMGLIPLTYIVITIILCKYFWKRIFRRRWKHKNLFERFVEMAFYCSMFILFLFVLQSDKGIKTLHLGDLFKTGFLKAESDITKTNQSIKLTKKRPGVDYYQVRPGDSLLSISRRHGMSLNELLRLNNFVADTIIHPGQKVIVSKTGK